MSVDMSTYCSAHDEWLIMKLCMYVGYHDANNVTNFGGQNNVEPYSFVQLPPFRYIRLENMFHPQRFSYGYFVYR